MHPSTGVLHKGLITALSSEDGFIKPGKHWKTANGADLCSGFGGQMVHVRSCSRARFSGLESGKVSRYSSDGFGRKNAETAKLL